MAVKSRVKVARKEVTMFYIYIDIQFRQIPMTAVAVEQYRPAMDSCMVGIRLYRACALAAPDSSDPGEYPEEHGKYRKCESKYERIII